MSISRDEDISCPSCGKNQKVTVWLTINVTADTSLRECLFNGEINLFQCSNCEFKGFLPVPLLYHDMQRNFCVQYFPYESINGKDFLEQFTKDGQIIEPKFAHPIPQIQRQRSGYLLKPHIVFDLNEMIRYVHFREKLHERVKAGHQ